MIYSRGTLLSVRGAAAVSRALCFVTQIDNENSCPPASANGMLMLSKVNLLGEPYWRRTMKREAFRGYGDSVHGYDLLRCRDSI